MRSHIKIKNLSGQTLLLEFKAARELNLRLAIAKRIFTLGAWVLGCQVVFT